jgi:hypothetical protein
MAGPTTASVFLFGKRRQRVLEPALIQRTTRHAGRRAVIVVQERLAVLLKSGRQTIGTVSNTVVTFDPVER